MKVFLLMAAVQFANYLNLVVNFRAIAHRKYGWAVASDAMASAFTFFVITKLAEIHTYPALAGMVIGGAFASACGIYLTEHWDETVRNRPVERCVDGCHGTGDPGRRGIQASSPTGKDLRVVAEG